jgi:hypothetical protein
MAAQTNKLGIFPGKSKNSINLLFKEGFENTASGRVLTWAVSAGRAIVILTEVIVIIAFLSRFWLDRKLTNLNDANDKKKAQVELSLSFENDFRGVQSRLAAYKALNSINFKASGFVDEMGKYLPEDIVLTSIEVTEDNVEVKGKAFTDQGLAIFLKGMNSSDKYTNVGLADISVASGDSSFGFVVRADKKSAKKKPANNDGQNIEQGGNEKL